VGMMTKTQNLVEIKLRNNEDFLKIRETLTRIGVASRKEKVLYQSCHILHKQGQYYLVHFKELFILDGKPSNFSEEDMARRNTIANLMHEWELLDIVNHQQTEYPTAPISQIKIIPYKEKDEWELVAKYNIGKRY
jgi:hypothetical protein